MQARKAIKHFKTKKQSKRHKEPNSYSNAQNKKESEKNPRPKTPAQELRPLAPNIKLRKRVNIATLSVRGLIQIAKAEGH